MSQPTVADCRRAVVALHDCFVAWYNGGTDEETFARIEDALAPDFELVSPDGDRLSRETVLDSIHDQRGAYEGGFDIDIRNVELLASSSDLVGVRYEEWQSTPNEETGRISTALLRPAPDASEGLVWVTVHENWLTE